MRKIGDFIFEVGGLIWAYVEEDEKKHERGNNERTVCTYKGMIKEGACDPSFVRCVNKKKWMQERIIGSRCETREAVVV